MRKLPLKRIQIITLIALAAALSSVPGCGKAEAPKAPTTTPTTTPKALSTTDAKSVINKLYAALKVKNPDLKENAKVDPPDGDEIIVLSLRECNVSDLSALAGMKLHMIDLSENPVTDLSPLKGMPLDAVYLEGTKVSDLSPLKGATIVEIYLSRTPISDLSPLEGMPISSLNLLGTHVENIAPLATMPLNSLWLNSTPVSDISPLAGCRQLITLTLYGTHVTDLTPIAGLLQLQRLHIGNTNITDLRPLERMNLTRLIFDPAKIEHGIELIRDMPGLQEIGTTLDTRMSPREFWQRYDAGEFKK
ncbi:MAG: hypothetical protein WD768_14545 [Phycisphaeraceae bacterium]